MAAPLATRAPDDVFWPAVSRHWGAHPVWRTASDQSVCRTRDPRHPELRGTYVGRFGYIGAHRCGEGLRRGRITQEFPSKHDAEHWEMQLLCDVVTVPQLLTRHCDWYAMTNNRMDWRYTVRTAYLAHLAQR